ncbi:MAG: HlyD family type I secretion periplasmic adaptor subunit, partial [Boseongicola sp.]|nr:HlyD family type I secretion periplasmic adaptor subunit [Boseongicola sp.]
VIAHGKVEVSNISQVVQHPDGGVVAQLQHRDGDFVSAGDILVRLDDTFLQSELSALDRRLVELSARRARLEAERDGSPSFQFTDDLEDKATEDPEIQRQLDGQRRLFDTRHQALAQSHDEIGEQVKQTRNAIIGMMAQRDAVQEQSRLLATELNVQRDLLTRGLAQAAKVSAMEREAARLRGDIGSLTADMAKAQSEVAELRLRGVSLSTAHRETAIATLRDLEYQEVDLAAQFRSLEERIRRMSIRAPVSGIVHNSTVHALHTVIQAGETIMTIVPQDQPLIVSSQLEAAHIDDIHHGQSALLKFSSFDARTTPELSGTVVEISADALFSDTANKHFYRVKIIPDTGNLEVSQLDLLPGMPVEAFLKTSDRSPLSYFLQPLTDYLDRALREG